MCRSLFKAELIQLEVRIRFFKVYEARKVCQQLHRLKI